MVKNIFTQSERLKPLGVFAWTLPAHVVTLTDGSRLNTCPQAGICAGLCYAKTGRWNFSNVKAAHIAKLEWVLSDLAGWRAAVLDELKAKKYRGAFVRIHDAGDFFSPAYAQAWLQIAAATPDVRFYAYTKEVALFKQRLVLEIPTNFTPIYSFGGRQDHLIDVAQDRHSDVFPTIELLRAAGYEQVCADDRKAATSPNNRIGLVTNAQKHLQKKQGGTLTFADWQQGKRPPKAAKQQQLAL